MAELGRILVTGASGFVGSALCRRLQGRGATVRALLRRQQEGPWQETVLGELGGDSFRPESCFGVQTLFHLAAKVHEPGAPSEGDEDYERVNVQGTEQLLAAAAACGVERFVYFSSVKAMGEEARRPVDEAHEGRPACAYGRSKREAEDHVLACAAIPHRCVLRPAMVYGPGSPGNLARMIRAVEKRRFPPLPEVRNRRSMVHVDDLVEAALLAAESPAAEGRTYLVTDGLTYSTRQIYDWIRQCLGRRGLPLAVPLFMLRGLALMGDGVQSLARVSVPFDTASVRKLLGSAWYSSERIRAELGFEPSWSLRQALPEMVALSAES